ncbi:MAG: hypothetical protein ACKVS6_17080 [Planctomycetota bacterium]
MTIVTANAGAAAAAAAAAARIRAVRAMGVIIQIEPRDFLDLIKTLDKPVVVHAMFGIFTKHNRYLTSHKGFAFYTDSKTPLDLRDNVESIEARSIWIPS